MINGRRRATLVVLTPKLATLRNQPSSDANAFPPPPSRKATETNSRDTFDGYYDQHVEDSSDDEAKGQRLR